MAAVWYVCKKIIARFLFPVGQVLLLWLAGAIVWLRWPKSRLGPALLLSSGLLLLFYAMPITGGFLLHRLEIRNWHYAQSAKLQEQGVRTLVVLSGSQRGGELTTGDRLSSDTMRRVMEGVRLWRGMSESKLVLSGGSFIHKTAIGSAMEDLAKELGVPSQKIVIEADSWDTDDQAKLLAPMLGREPFALITSAAHLPRALAIFRSYGLKPLPAPADFITKGRKLSFYSFLPQVGGLNASEVALYEYLGLTWLWLKGLVGGGPEPLAQAQKGVNPS
jgi:uncharacterized SAM-binding protein YcdF (DUF218 family)